MSQTKYNIRIGTSGFYYNHWKGLFYPDDLPKNEWLEYFAKSFDTVEINNTFYQLPKKETIKSWYERTPENFSFTIKANRFITHIKKLKDSAESLKHFFETINILKEKLGPVLYQLPPSMKKNIGLLKAFIRLLPKNNLAVFEFRNISWFSQDTYDLLSKTDSAFCIHDLQGITSPHIITRDNIYIRFHGSMGRYHGDYSDDTLEKWAIWIKQNLKKNKTLYAYFNNDVNANAIKNAKTLKQLFLK